MRTPSTVLLIGLIGCTEAESPDAAALATNPSENDVIAIGDSIMEWFAEEDASIAHAAAQATGRGVRNLAISGAMLTYGEDEMAAIPNQYEPGDWSWLLMDGGANDLNDLCGCGSCDALLDEMVSADGRDGVLPSLVGPIAASGVRVAIMGYPELPAEAAFGFDRCGGVLSELSARMSVLAGHDPRVHFVDMRDIISGDDTEMFDGDLVHPSPQGAAAMGAYLAERMELSP